MSKEPGADGPRIVLRPALPAEAEALSALCMRSKASHGYDAAFMEACREELTLSAETISLEHICVAEISGETVGMAHISRDAGVAELEALFIEPDKQHSGAGRALFEWSTATAKALGAETLLITSDPDAKGFYARMGAVEAGKTPSGSIPGRYLPVLKFQL